MRKKEKVRNKEVNTINAHRQTQTHTHTYIISAHDLSNAPDPLSIHVDLREYAIINAPLSIKICNYSC